MPKPRIGIAGALALVAGILVAAPASAAVTGTICGEVTAFTAPTAIADGSITIDGTAEVIDSGATSAIDAATLTTLAAVASADATTCVAITADGAGQIVDIAVAANASICGEVALDTTTGAYTVDGVMLAPGVVNADATAAAVLEAALSANADVCADVTVDTSTGLVADVAVRAAIDACGTVVLEADGDAVVGGVTLPAELIDAELRSVLQAAVLADAAACASVDAVSTGGSTSVAVTVWAEVCLEVTALTDTTVDLAGITFAIGGEFDATAEVGDVVCTTVAAGPGEPPTAGVSPAASGGTTGQLPDTALAAPEGSTAPAAALLVAIIAMAVVTGVQVARRAA